ncbi:hypothetical protein [Lutibaculum baratangense]|uniref:Uncharacterized protein n=1 Tax=Lutibaculum baratangense AMV1 TaxID=631454 RepID=V4RBC4_9HYPH|nr:hypothetical protein [Lutibaculum baratangense]ESR22704.1 hypothetical protein N177_3841 [Lutibaculum baratangense AMV1]
MGLLDLPAPLFSWVDGQLGRLLPTVLVVVLWAVVASFASMELYRALSPQAKIAGLRTRLADAQARLAGYDGPFEGAGPLIREMLGLALKRVIVVLPSTLIASLPLLMLIIWLDSSYGRDLPAAGQRVEVTAPPGYSGEWVDGAPRLARITSDSGETVAEVPVEAPVPVIHKRRWWNALIGNPAGYLSEQLPIDWITLDLPGREMLSAGPWWTRRWEFVFFPALVLMSLALKHVRRIE